MTRSQSGNNTCNQVVYEIQECHEGGEAELGQAYDACVKGSGHDKFIPVNDFGLEHLPTGYQGKEVFDLIQCLQFLTCRLIVRYSSNDRPECFPVSQEPYPCYTDKGQSSHFHTGSGWVGEVVKITKGETRRFDRNPPMTCPDCGNSDTPCKEWFEVVVSTARHVVFDDSEVRETEVELFYDDKDRKKVKKLHGWKMWDDWDIEDDGCSFVCYTHDMELGQSLMEKVELFKELSDEIDNKFYPNEEDSDPSKHPLTVIVSHPHGCHKQISVGELKETQKDDDAYYEYNKYTYTTATCPGSSGAFVWTIGYHYRYGLL